MLSINPDAASREDVARLAAELMAAMQHTEAVEAEHASLNARIANYENGILWQTTCINCAHLLDQCVAETFRAEKAEARNARLTITLQFISTSTDSNWMGMGEIVHYQKLLEVILDRARAALSASDAQADEITLASLAGIAPDATGNLSSEEFIRQIRNPQADAQAGTIWAALKSLSFDMHANAADHLMSNEKAGKARGSIMKGFADRLDAAVEAALKEPK
ncbi:MAG: hypothetical protein Q7T18_11830 [Sedimentisphaerales bacterium]|nr:hypothetical protein [Sedimentisphaerales bacterium]